ncbi:MAG: anthranilate synthase component I family protein [Nevskiaceae bacterium]
MMQALAIPAQAACAAEEPFAALVSAVGHAERGRRSLLARELRHEFSLDLATTPAEACAALRDAASAAFARGASGLLVLVAHEAAALFDRIPTQAPWLGLPRVQLFSTTRLVEATAGGGWPAPQAQPHGILHSRVSAAWHAEAVETIRKAISAGDIYQACLTFPLEAIAPPHLGDLFAALVASHPVDHAAWCRVPGLEIASLSPERFFSLRGRTLTARPMKGTRGLVGASDQERLAAVKELAASPKDRAENVMIVDLLRNDLGRICAPGSVRVEGLWEVEEYRSVAQMTSTVRGELSEQRDFWDALAALFPPGSMTGAPKIAACGVLEALEVMPRGLYGGAIGWVDPSGDAEFSVVIRTLQSRAGQLRWDIGGGIVSDSTSTGAWAEAWAKAALLEPFVDFRHA